MAKGIDFSKYPEEVRLAGHAIGLDYHRPYTRHGRRFYRPYRNYYGISEECPGFALWAQLQAEGKARRKYSPVGYGDCIFSLTRAGLDWLGDQLGCHIYDIYGKK